MNLEENVLNNLQLIKIQMKVNLIRERKKNRYFYGKEVEIKVSILKIILQLKNLLYSRIRVTNDKINQICKGVKKYHQFWTNYWYTREAGYNM